MLGRIRKYKTITMEENLNVLITGGNRGIGKAIKDIFLENGYRVFITSTKESTVKRMNADNKVNNLTYLHGDFSTDTGINSFISLLNELPSIDVCINNAGINIINKLESVTEDNFDMIQRVNVKAPYLISKYLLPVMKSNNYGRIVNISSIWGTITKEGRSGYSTSKSAVLGFTRTLAVEYSKYNTLVNAVSPGFTLTDLTRESLTDNEINELNNKIPMNKMADPKDIAEIVFFLASDKNRYITGQNIIADGGFSIV